MSEKVPEPVVVPPSPFGAQLQQLAAAALVLISGFTAVAGFLKTRDLIGLLQFIRGTEGLAFLGAVGFVGTIAWRQFGARRQHAAMLTVAADPRVPDEVAQVKQA